MKGENSIKHSGELTKGYSKNKPVALELYSSAGCNLNCKYCTIPKGDELRKTHINIIEKIRDGTFLEEIYNFYGTDLEIISHGGTEPTLTIHYFTDFYDKALEIFPNLNSIKLSSNFLTNIDNLKSFIKFLDYKVSKEEKEFNLYIQVSLDGPSGITDSNRKEGGTEQILKNFFSLIKFLNELNPVLKINLTFKPTVGKELYPSLAKRLDEYYLFFDKIFDDFFKINSLRNVKISKRSQPTVVFPEKHTKQDGINFSYLLEKHRELCYNNKFKHVVMNPLPYIQNFDKLYDLGNEFFTKYKMFTCSAGDSQFGLLEDGSISMCHEPFFITNKKYESMLNGYQKKMIDDAFQPLESERGTLKYIRRSSLNHPGVVGLNYLRTLRTYHDFPFIQLSFVDTMIRELSYSNQISKIYKNDFNRKILTYFMCSFNACPFHSKYMGGSYMVPMYYYIKLWGNGAFKQIIKEQLVRRKNE